MLTKSKRLNLTKDFKWVVNGKKIETETFKFFLKIGDNKQALVGIITPKQIFKKAYIRNRARRITSKVIEQIYPNLPNNLNLVIMPKADIFKKRVEELTNELTNIKEFSISY